jgi:DNA repair protein RecO
MTQKSSPAFVLAVYPYKERNAVVVLCTEGEGIKRAAVKGVKGRRSKFGAVLTTLSEITAHFFEHEKGELINLTDADLIKSAIPLVLNLPCPAILDHLAEMTMEFVQENEANPGMYRLLRTVLDALEAGLPWQQVKTYFDFWVLRLNGTLPDITRCRCGRPAGYWDHDALKPRCAAHAVQGIPYPGGLPDLAAAIRARKPAETPPFEPNREAYRFLHSVLGELRTRFLSKALKSSALLGECDKLFSV